MKIKHRMAITVFTVVSLVYVLPMVAVLINSFKKNTFVKSETFALPDSESFAGVDNFVKGMTFGNYPFIKSVVYSVLITAVSTAMILVFASMAAWFIVRVDNLICKVFYYLCIFSMVVPFQMIMYTLARTADKLYLNTPFTIPVVYLGVGAGMAVFMFSGFVRSVPMDVEEAASIDGCGPVKTFFCIVIPMMKPTLISVGILEISILFCDVSSVVG